MQRPAQITTSGSASGPIRRWRMKTATIALAILAALTFALPAARAQQPDKEHEELSKALNAAKIPLQRGLAASAKEGKPISGKVRGRARPATALGLHDEGRQVLRGHRGPQDGKGRQSRADHRGRRS